MSKTIIHIAEYQRVCKGKDQGRTLRKNVQTLPLAKTEVFTSVVWCVVVISTDAE